MRSQSFIKGQRVVLRPTRQTIENELGEPIGEAFYKAEHEYFGYRAEKMTAVLRPRTASGQLTQ